MVDIKSLSSPRIAIPIVGIIVLVVVTTLVAVFYVRNPTVTDGLFGASDATTQSSLMDNSSDHTSASQGFHPAPSTTPSSVEQPSTTLASTTTPTHSMTSPPTQDSTPMHAIEPTQHL